MRAASIILVASLSASTSFGAVGPGPRWQALELRRVEGLLAADRASPQAFEWLARAWELRHFLGDDGRLGALFGALAEDPAAQPLVRDHARWYRAALDTRSGNLPAAEAAMLALGFPPDLAVVGPFENLGNAGFGEPFEPEMELTSGATPGALYPGAEGDVRWRELPRLGHLGRIDPGRLLTRGEDAVAYIRVAVHLEAAAEAALRIGSDAAVKAWVDGRLVHAFDGRRTAELDQDAAPVRLPAGWSRLMVKLAWRESGGTAYVRLTSPAGGPLPGLTYDASAKRFVGPSPSPAEAAATHIAWHPQTHLEDRLSAAGAAATAEDWAALAYLRTHFGREDEAEDLDAAAWRRALALAPDSPPLLHGLATALTDDENARRAALEAAVEKRPHVPSLVALVRHYRRRSDGSKATRWAARLGESDPGHPLLALVRADEWEAAGAPVLALREIRQALDSDGQQPALHRKAAALLRELHDPAGELEAQRRYLGLEAASGRAMRRVVRLLRGGLGDLDATLAARRHILRYWPWSVTDRIAAARLLAENGRELEALAELARLETDFPEHASIPEEAGRLLHRLGRSEGLVALERALALRPQNRRLRDLVRRLRPGQGTLEDRYAVELQRVLDDAAPPGASELGAHTALHLEAIQVHDNGLASRFVQQVIRVGSRTQVDGYRVVPIRFVPGQELVEVLAAERIDPEGRVHKATRVVTRGPFGKSGGMYLNNKVRQVEFSDLAPGDAIHLRYRVDEVARRNLFGDFFGHITHLQSAVPRRRVTAVFEMPTDRALYHGGRKAGDPAITRRGDVTVHRWDWTDIEPLIREPSMPGYPEVGRFLSVSTYRDWDEMVGWYANLIRDQFELDDEAKALVRRLTASETTVQGKVAALHGWVVRNTRYVGIEFGIHGFKPYRADRVLQRGYGDCKDKATLLVSLLGEAGIDANVALLRTVDRGVLEPTPATLWAFNHAITYVPELDLWLDGTHEHAGTGELPNRDQGAMALVVDLDGTGRLVRTPILPAAANSWTTIATGNVDARGSVRVEVEERVRGQGAEFLRRHFQDASERRVALERLLSRRQPGTHVERVEISGLDELEQDPVLRFEATIPGLLAVDGRKATLPVTLYPTGLAERLAPTAERVHDLQLKFPWSEEGELRLRLPEGYVVEELPDDFTLVNRYGELGLSAAVEGREIVIRTRLIVAVRRVPVEEYPDFRAFALEVDRAEARRIRLMRAEGDGD